MKIIFAGTPLFAVPSLQALLNTHHDVVAVYTKPDSTSGRGRRLNESPIKTLAMQYQLNVCQPTSLRDEGVQAVLHSFKADVMVVVAYGLLLPAAVLKIPKLSCVNVHPSLLPRWRGAAPIQHTILSGDAKTGVCIMMLDEGMDTGPLLASQETDVVSDETSGQLHDRLSEMGAALLVNTLNALEKNTLTAHPQSSTGVTYATKITKAQAQLDFTEPARILAQCVRAYNPAPIAYTIYRGQDLRVFEAVALDVSCDSAPGSIILASKEGIDVATGSGVLRLLTLQLPGGKRLSASAFLNGIHEIASSYTFGSVNMLVILDRDGVINENSAAYIKTPDEWIAIPGSLEAIVKLNQAGHCVVVMTNQSGVGRGYYDEAMLKKIHDKMCHELQLLGGQIDCIYYCPHLPEVLCNCRKPKTGMLHAIQHDFPKEWRHRIVIGDSLSDIEAGLAMHCQVAFLGTTKVQGNVPVFRDLSGAVDAILKGYFNERIE